MIELAGFIAASFLLAWLSRHSLRAVGTHGFHRFFAWEFIAALVLLNVRLWFHDPLSPHQIVAWILLVVSGVLVIHGAHLLRVIGKPNDARKEESLLKFERTSELVTIGAYKYIRHPLYSSLLFLAWGVFFKDPGWLGGALAGGASIFLVATAKADEKECLRFFGPAYEAYRTRTRMFIPFVF